MKKFFKWTGIIFGGLIILLLLVGLVLYAVGKKKLKESYPDIAVQTVAIPTDSAAIAHGKHLAIIWACTRSHSANLGGTLIKHDPIDGLVSLMGGAIPASNLTSGKGGIARSYGDADWIRAIRHGVKPNGRVEIFMYDYSSLSDADLGDLIAYLKQAAPVDAEYPQIRYGPILPVASAIGIFTPVAGLIDHDAKSVADPVPTATKEYGKYLSAACTGCHGAGPVARLRGKWTQEGLYTTATKWCFTKWKADCRDAFGYLRRAQ